MKIKRFVIKDTENERDKRSFHSDKEKHFSYMLF